MKAVPEFKTSYSIADYFREINRAFHNNDEKYYRIPQKKIDVLDFYEVGDAETIERAVSPDLGEAKRSFQLTCETIKFFGQFFPEVLLSTMQRA